MTTNELRFQTHALLMCQQLHRRCDSLGFAALADDVLDAANLVRAELLAYDEETVKRVVTADNDFTERGLPFPDGEFLQREQ